MRGRRPRSRALQPTPPGERLPTNAAHHDARQVDGWLAEIDVRRTRIDSGAILAHDSFVYVTHPPGAFWPSELQQLLLIAALAEQSTAVEAWQEVRPRISIDELEPGSFQLLPLIYSNLSEARHEDVDLPRLKGIYRRTWVKTTSSWSDRKRRARHFPRATPERSSSRAFCSRRVSIANLDCGPRRCSMSSSTPSTPRRRSPPWHVRLDRAPRSSYRVTGERATSLTRTRTPAPYG